MASYDARASAVGVTRSTEPREVLSARFPPDIAAAAKRAAAAEGKSVSEWISELAVVEIARRENRCPACGHELDDEGRPRGSERLTP